MLVAGTAYSLAQEVDNTLQFVDKDGKVIADGSVITRNEVTEDEFEGPMIKAEIYVKNTSGQEQGVYVKGEVKKMDCGKVQTCIGGCTTWDNVGSYISPKELIAGGGSLDLATEWMLPEDVAENASCTVTYQIVRVESLGGFPPKYGEEYPGATITVTYVNGNVAGIDGTQADSEAEVVARYNANGQLLNAPAKGLNIIKLSNGKTLKSINN